MAAVSPVVPLSVTHVLERREQGQPFVADATPRAHATSAQLLAAALAALDAESAECLPMLSLAIERAATPHDARICCAIALVVLDLDIGTLSNVAAWIERFNASKDAPVDHPIDQFWCRLGDMVAHSYDDTVIDLQRLRHSANSVLEGFGALDSPISADTQVVAGQMLLNYAIEREETALIDLVVSIVTHPKLMPHAKPVTQARFFEELGYKRFNLNNPAQAKEDWRNALAIAEQHGLSAAGFMARIGLTRQLLDEQDYVAAEKNIASFKLAEGFGRGYVVAQYKHLRARYALLRKNMAAAQVEIDQAFAIARRIGVFGSGFHLYLQEKAQILLMLDKAEEAEQLLNQAEDLELGNSGAGVKTNALLIHFLRLYPTDTPAAIDALIKGLSLASSIGFVRFLRSVPELAAKVCAVALENKVCVNFVNQVIVQRRLPAPEGTGPYWPWHLCIRVLGPLIVELNGKPLAFPGRTQAKPLELLCYLATSVDMRTDSLSLCAALWGTEDIAKSSKSLETTISRLRKLLGMDDIVRVAHGQISLDNNLVWCDWSHLRTLSLQLSKLATTGRSNTSVNIEKDAQDLLEHYRGSLLAGSDETPWLLGRRDDAVQLFVAAALAAKNAWRAHDEQHALVPFLESALHHEPLSEGLVMALMQHYALHQQPADAMRIYRFFRNQLSLRTGLQPSATVESLKSKLLL